MRMRTNSSSHSGLGEWLFQRLSAVYLGVFSVFLFAKFLFWPVSDFAEWQAWFSLSWVRVIWLFAFASLLIHAWIGVRSVLLDYISSFSLRFIIALLFATGLLVSGLWVIDILYGRGA